MTSIEDWHDEAELALRIILREREAEETLRKTHPLLQEAWENYQMIKKLYDSNE